MKKIKFIPHDEKCALASIPPKPAISLLPDWYKSIPPRHTQKKLHQPLNAETHNHTVKKCVPFLDAMSNGYMAVLTDDVYVEQVEVEEPGITKPFFRWKTDVELITWHSKVQYDGLPIPKGYDDMVAKFSNQWEFETPKGFSIFFTHPSNRFDLPFLTISGFVDTDTYQSPVQFPFFLRTGFEGIIESGTPIAQLHLVKRESWESEVIPYDKNDAYIKKREFFRTFAESYKKNFWVKKQYR